MNFILKFDRCYILVHDLESWYVNSWIKRVSKVTGDLSNNLPPTNKDLLYLVANIIL